MLKNGHQRRGVEKKHKRYIHTIGHAAREGWPAMGGWGGGRTNAMALNVLTSVMDGAAASRTPRSLSCHASSGWHSARARTSIFQRYRSEDSRCRTRRRPSVPARSHFLTLASQDLEFSPRAKTHDTRRRSRTNDPIFDCAARVTAAGAHLASNHRSLERRTMRPQSPWAGARAGSPRDAMLPLADRSLLSPQLLSAAAP